MADGSTTATAPEVTMLDPIGTPLLLECERGLQLQDAADDETDKSDRSSDSEEEGSIEDADDDIHTDADIFEEDSDDESSLDDGLSERCYEELDNDASLVTFVDRILDEDQPYESEASNWSADVFDSDTDMDDEDTYTPSTSRDSQSTLSIDDSAIAEPVTLSAAERQKFDLCSYEKDIEFESARWELKAAEEELFSAQEKIAMLSSHVLKLKKRKQEAEDKVASSFEECGISPQLYAEYEAFCESLNPKYGLRGGFTVVTPGVHRGDYIQYDPNFAIFKESVEDEMPYNDRNFRVEASFVTPRTDYFSESTSPPKSYHQVSFWPLKCPEPMNDDVKTWGDQYPDLYRLLVDAVREDNSEAAMEMLIRLPDMNSTLGGGWLFDYQPEPTLAKHPIESMRWRFRSAHKIDSPVSVKGKLLRLQLMLQPEKISEAATSNVAL